MTAMPESRQTAVLGGGCFWCLEAVFDQLAGVQSVESGYAGGRNANPTYEAVCSGATGHAEVVRISFDHLHQLQRRLFQLDALRRRLVKRAIDDVRPVDQRLDRFRVESKTLVRDAGDELRTRLSGGIEKLPA